jgi:hypothetical protein
MGDGWRNVETPALPTLTARARAADGALAYGTTKDPRQRGVPVDPVLFEGDPSGLEVPLFDDLNPQSSALRNTDRGTMEQRQSPNRVTSLIALSTISR